MMKQSTMNVNVGLQSSIGELHLKMMSHQQSPSGSIGNASGRAGYFPRFVLVGVVTLLFAGCVPDGAHESTHVSDSGQASKRAVVESAIGDGAASEEDSKRGEASGSMIVSKRSPDVPAASETEVSRPPRQRTFPQLSAISLQPPVPGDNPITQAKVELGKLLFFDTRLSGDTGTSCATCHEPILGWGDGNTLSMGYDGTEHWRNSQTIINTGYLGKLFWAGESPSLEAQAKSAITGNLAGNGDPAMIEERLKQIPLYVRMFEEAYGVSGPTFPLILKAIATFERVATNSTDSPFDRFMRGDESAMSEQALRGKTLFEGKAGCIQCHNGMLLTDESFYNLGVPVSPLFEQSALHQISLRYQFHIRGVPEAVYRTAKQDLGLYYSTKRPEDRGKFRTPPLRYLEYTDPYMHNGAFASLEEVIDFYDQGGGDDDAKSPLLEPLGLTSDEKADLLEFLKALSGSEVEMDEPDLPPYEVID